MSTGLLTVLVLLLVLVLVALAVVLLVVVLQRRRKQIRTHPSLFHAHSVDDYDDLLGHEMLPHLMLSMRHRRRLPPSCSRL